VHNILYIQEPLQVASPDGFDSCGLCHNVTLIILHTACSLDIHLLFGHLLCHLENAPSSPLKEAYTHMIHTLIQILIHTYTLIHRRKEVSTKGGVEGPDMSKSPFTAILELGKHS